MYTALVISISFQLANHDHNLVLSGVPRLAFAVYYDTRSTVHASVDINVSKHTRREHNPHVRAPLVVLCFDTVCVCEYASSSYKRDCHIRVAYHVILAVTECDINSLMKKNILCSLPRIVNETFLAATLSDDEKKTRH
jgi:hypothetical protein